MDFWSPLQFTSFRFLLGGLILLLFINIKDIKLNNKIGFVSSSLASALILAIAALFQQIGIVTTSATNAGFYTSLYVIMVPLIGIFLFKIPHWSIWPCVIICFFGSVLLGTSDGDLFSLNLKYGDIWIISSAVFWAIHLHIVSYSVARFPVLIFSILQFILCGIFLLLYGIFFQSSSIFSFERVDIFGFFYSSLLLSGISLHWLYFTNVRSKVSSPNICRSHYELRSYFCRNIWLVNSF